MVHAICSRTSDLQLFRKSLPALLKEYHFWNSGINKVTIQDAQSCNHTLNWYYAMWNKPRPESSTIPRRGCFEIREKGGETFISLLVKNFPCLDARLSDICISISATPTYLPAYQFKSQDNEGNVRKFNLIDGGVAANNLVYNHLEGELILNCIFDAQLLTFIY